MDSNTNIAAAPPPQVAPPEKPGRKLEKVFVSYASADSAFAADLAKELREAGVKVWIAEDSIDPGEVWSRKLAKELQSSGAVVLVVSPDSQVSDYVDKELHGARAFNIPVIPVIHRPCGFWFEISNLEHIDFTEVYREGFARLIGTTIPPRPWSRKVLVFLKRNRIHLYVIAAIIAGLLGLYYLPPSDTSFTVLSGDASGMLVRVHNRGGRPSMLAGDSFELDFGALPFELQKLALQDPQSKSLIPGHSDVQIRLTPTTSTLTPKPYPDTPHFVYNKDELMPLLGNAKVTLRGSIEESNDRRPRRSCEVQAKDIGTFIYERFPKIVSRTEINW
jgi:hypothetical protein